MDRVWICVHETKEGSDVGVYDSEDAAYAGMADMIRSFDWWKEALEEDGRVVDGVALPPEPPSDDRKCVELYFGVMNEASNGEWVDIDQRSVRTVEDVNGRSQI